MIIEYSRGYIYRRKEGRLRFHPHRERWGLPAPPPSPPQVKEDPFRHVKRMKGYHLFIRRVGKYRVLLDIQNGEMKILVLKVGKRSNVYDENRMHF